MLEVKKETNSLLAELNNSNSKSSSGDIIPVIKYGEDKTKGSIDDAVKMHSAYLNTEFSQPIESAPLLGKIPRNSYNFDVIVENVATPSNFYVSVTYYQT